MSDILHNQQTRQLEVLVRVSEMLTTLDLDDVLHKVIQLTTEVVGASQGSFFLLNQPGQDLTLQRFLAIRNYDPEMKQYVSERVLSEGLAHWVFTHKEAAVVEDTRRDRRWITLEGETIVARSALCVPFFYEDQVYGILTLEHPDPGHFADSDKRLAKAVANQASAAMRNAQLFDRINAQQRQLEAVLYSTTEALFTLDHQGRIGLVNPAAEEVLGQHSAELVGKAFSALAERNPFMAEIESNMRQANLTVGTQSFEVHEAKTRRDFVINISVLSQTQNQDVGSVIALHDVTSLKDLSRLKTHMLQMASHDLKNPLGVLLGYLDMLREDTQNGLVPDMQFVEGMLRAVDRMDLLIQTLLSPERIEQQATQRLQSINPHQLLAQVLDDMEDSARARQHDVRLEVDPQTPTISGDPIELREAMGNLVGNAIKYTPPGGTITIRMSAEDGRFFFSVVDTGLGIPADQQNSIFRKYFRAQQPATAEITGTGLGLSLVMTIVERHGGQVWFQSEEGAGSTFGFWLPLLNTPD